MLGQVKASLVSFPPSTHLLCYNWGKGAHVLLLGDVFTAAFRTYYGNWMLSPDIKSALKPGKQTFKLQLTLSSYSGYFVIQIPRPLEFLNQTIVYFFHFYPQHNDFIFKF